MQEQRFIGVYATSEMPSTLGASHRPMIRRKRLWFVWEMDDGKYRVQPLNAIHAPMAEPRVISPREFENRFTAETECEAVPAGYVPEGAEAQIALDAEDGASTVPDATAQPDLASQGAPAALRADDPNLLRLWLEGKAPPAPAPDAGLTPAQEAEMARLLEGALLDSPQEGMAAESAGPAGEIETGREDAPERDAEQALRADFALALLQMKQGRKDEGVAGLERMLARPCAPFSGAALLFSEFGLSLRRLGLIHLALLAHQHALEFAPDDERVHFNLARSYHDLNKFGMARVHLERAVEIAPDFTVARQFLDFLRTKEPESLSTTEMR